MAFLNKLWLAIKAYAVNNGVNLDCLLNSLLLCGKSRETITQHAWRAMRERGARWGCILCGLLHLVDTDHCEKYGPPLDARVKKMGGE